MKKTPIMKMKRNLCVSLSTLALVFLLAFSFTACGNSAASPPADSVLKVENNYISQSQLDEYTLFMVNLLILTQGMDYDSFVTDEIIESTKPNILDLMSQTEALKIHFAGNADVLKADAIATQVKEFKEQLFSYPGTEDRFKSLKITDDAIRYYVETSLLHEALKVEATEDGTYPTDEEVSAFYYEHQVEFLTPEQRKASQVFFADPDHKPETKTLAEGVLKKLKDGDAKFEDMAAQYNTDASKDTDGDMGFIPRDSYDIDFEDALYSLEGVDSISDVVETVDGYCIIKLTEIQDAELQELDDIKGDITNYLAYELEAAKATEITGTMNVEYLSDKYPAPDLRPDTASSEDGVLPDELYEEIEGATE